MAPRFRLISPPDCLGIAQLSILSGPRGIGAGSNALLDGGDQTFSTVGNLWRIAVPLVQSKGARARRQRGIVTALGDGSLAMRLRLPDRDRMTRAEAGVVGTTAPQAWSGGTQWSGSVRWRVGYPSVSVAVAAPAGFHRIALPNTLWGRELEVGDMIGFWPSHFGWYVIVGVEPGGAYRIWPELRKAITTDTFVTLQPTAVFRAMPGSFGWQRDGLMQSGAALQLVEVPDNKVRNWYTIE